MDKRSVKNVVCGLDVILHGLALGIGHMAVEIHSTYVWTAKFTTHIYTCLLRTQLCTEFLICSIST